MEILRLSEARRRDVGIAGGKGANLGEILALGLPVPRGFVVPTAAYAEHLTKLGLDKSLSDTVARRDWAAVEGAAWQLLGSEPLQLQLEAKILAAYSELGQPAVAVRSSATMEDLVGASFAGQHATLLEVRGAQALVDAVRSCWASVWSRRALEYRHRHAIDHFSVAMAVVVQEMVTADAAGVLLTVDPVSGRDDRIVIEVAPGLGEAVVSGEATTERYDVERPSLELVGRGYDDGLLSPESIRELCGLALRLERHFGRPQDIEFAVAGGHLQLLQARPMTALNGVSPETLAPLPKPSYLDKLMKPIAVERYVMAPRPLDSLTFTRFVGGVVHALRQGGAVIAAEDEAAFRAQIWHQAYRFPRVRLTWRCLGMGRHYLQLLGRDWKRHWEDGPGPALRVVSQPVTLSELSDEALLERTESILAVWEPALNGRFEAAAAMEAEKWLSLLVLLTVGRKDRHQVMAGLMTDIESPSLEINRVLWDLSRRARQSSNLQRAVGELNPDSLEGTREGRAYRSLIESFLNEYGHREGACYYLSTPCWRRDPMPVWRVLSNMVKADHQPADSGQARTRHAAARALVERRLRWWPGLPRLFCWMVDRLRALHAFREASHFDVTRPLLALQDIAAEWGRRLARRGLLAHEEEVYLLTYGEVRSWLVGEAPPAEDARALLARRSVTYRVVNERWQAWRSTAAVPGPRATGVAVSPGSARGPARIIRDESEFSRLRPGEVVVCPHTNPAWTPLFTTAAAVVTETGGATSHAAIVAREYGIPAVMGVPGATKLFEDGAEIHVDGSRGVVERAATPTARPASPGSPDEGP